MTRDASRERKFGRLICHDTDEKTYTRLAGSQRLPRRRIWCDRWPDAQGVGYDETPIPGKGSHDFSFKKLDRAATYKLVSSMPKEVFVKRAIGGLDHLDVKTAKEVMLRIATLKGTEFNAESVKKIIEEVEARAKI